MNYNLPENPGLLKLPPDVLLQPTQEIAVFLLKAELKNRRFAEQLESIGFDLSYYSLDFGALIFQLCGIGQRNDEKFDWYQKRLEHYSQQINPREDDDTLTDYALKFYRDIIDHA